MSISTKENAGPSSWKTGLFGPHPCLLHTVACSVIEGGPETYRPLQSGRVPLAGLPEHLGGASKPCVCISLGAVGNVGAGPEKHRTESRRVL